MTSQQKTNELVELWRSLPSTPPFVLAHDQRAVPELFSPSNIISSQADTWPNSPDYLILRPKSSNKIHVNLFPEPYTGDIYNAPVVVLLKNPGFGDYLYREHESHSYLAAMRRNLSQEHVDGELKLFWFRPEFVMHGGFRYFRAKFSPLIQTFCERAPGGLTPSQALEVLNKTICVVQMTGYTSGSSPRNCARLPSSQAVFNWLREQVVPDVQNGRRALIIARAKKEWTHGLAGGEREWQIMRNQMPVHSIFDTPTRTPSFNPTKEAGKIILHWMLKPYGITVT